MMTLGPFSVAKDGTLTPRAPGIRPVLRYSWRGRACAAELTSAGLRLTALAGRIPSTADPHVDRGAVLAAVAALRERLPAGVTIHLMPDHRLLLRRNGIAPPDNRLRAMGLVTAMVRFAFAVDPFLDRLEEAGAGAIAARTS